MLLSDGMKLLIKKAREESLALNFSYIDTFHFFLADCRLNSPFSLSKFAFENQEKRDAFFESLPSLKKDNNNLNLLPLAKETEYTFRLGSYIQKKLGDEYFEPYHFFLAAGKIRKSTFSSMFSGTKHLFVKIEEYYIDTGVINESTFNRNIFERIMFELKCLTLTKF